MRIGSPPRTTAASSACPAARPRGGDPVPPSCSASASRSSGRRTPAGGRARSSGRRSPGCGQGGAEGDERPAVPRPARDDWAAGRSRAPPPPPAPAPGAPRRSACAGPAARNCRDRHTEPSDGGLSRWKASTSSVPMADGCRPSGGLDPSHGAEQVHHQGKSGPRGRSKSSAGPSCRTVRWRISDASRYGSTSAFTRRSCPVRSRWATNACRSGKGMSWSDGATGPGASCDLARNPPAYSRRSSRAKANTVTDMTAFMVKKAGSSREMSSGRTSWCS